MSSTSSPSPSFSRQSTSDFCANNMMNRDPIVGLAQRRSTTIEIDSTKETNDLEPLVKIDVQFEQEKQLPIEDAIIETNFNIENDEERIAVELAIKRSLEDQKENKDISNTVDSSSDSDGISNTNEY
jgi:hypothetical protein